MEINRTALCIYGITMFFAGVFVADHALELIGFVMLALFAVSDTPKRGEK